MSGDNLLIFSDSERDPNMLYRVGIFFPDPFIYLRLGGKCHIVMSDLEMDRARAQIDKCRVLSLTQHLKTLKEQGIPKPGTARVIQQILRSRRIKTVMVPEDFPLGLAQELGRLGIRLRIRKGLFFPERASKNAEEVKKISAAVMMAEVGLSEAIQTIKNSKVGRNRRLMYHGVPLTSEKLRAIIDTAIMQAGGLASHTIVAGGKQGCDPHEQGHGVLRAQEPIILDVFPRSQKTGYFGDITRTVVKGRASEAFRKVYHTIARAQEVAFEHLKNKIPACDIHREVNEFLEQQGYKTGKIHGRMEGFFHSLGHGLGLEIHEAPFLSPNSDETLRAGNVVTIEPGLYYTDLGGGIRLEDVALVTGNGPRNLTRFEKVFEV
jgi:Xaa-Pro aminopeptidase